MLQKEGVLLLPNQSQDLEESFVVTHPTKGRVFVVTQPIVVLEGFLLLYNPTSVHPTGRVFVVVQPARSKIYITTQ
jgi:hypothetical protein